MNATTGSASSAPAREGGDSFAATADGGARDGGDVVSDEPVVCSGAVGVEVGGGGADVQRRQFDHRVGELQFEPVAAGGQAFDAEAAELAGITEDDGAEISVAGDSAAE